MQKALAVNKCDGPTQQGVESRVRDNNKKSKRKKKGSKREREADEGLQERMDRWMDL